MKIATLICAIISELLMLSAITCGLWLRANNIAEQSSINFHMACGIGAAVFGLVTVVMLVVLLISLK